MSDWTPVLRFNPDLLAANLDALKQYRPDLYERIRLEIDSDSLCLHRTETGLVECAAIQAGVERTLIESSAIDRGLALLNSRIKTLANVSQAGLIYIIGWDLGYAFSVLYEKHLRDALWKLAVVVEPDLRLFAASLAVHDLREMLGKDRIFFAFGERWVDELTRLTDEENLFFLSNVDALFGCPTLTQTEQVIRSQVRMAAETAMRQARQSFERELHEASQYYTKKKVETVQKILALEMKGGMAVSYIHNRFLDECSAQGIQAIRHKTSALGGISFIRAIARERPDCVVLVNLAPEKYAPLALLNRLRVPRMVWFLDDPHNFIDERVKFGSLDFLFTWDFSYESFLRSRGAQSVDHFPYVADLDRVEAKVRDEFRAPVSYIGQVSEFLPQEHGMDDTTGEMCRRAGRQKGLEPWRSYGSLVAEFQGEFGLQIVQTENDPVPRNVCYAIYMVGNALLRIRVLERVMPFGLRLYGNTDWLNVLGDCPLGDCFQGPADPVRDVPDIFVSSQINLNIHSLHALASLNQRDFNCPLVGGFLLTDWVQDADLFFEPDREMVFYRDLDDLETKVRFFLENPDARKEIIQRGRERVLREHVYSQRVPRAIETLRRRIGERGL